MFPCFQATASRPPASRSAPARYARSYGATLAGAAVLFAAFHAKDASACSPPPEGAFLSPAAPPDEGVVAIARDGVIALRSECYGSCPTRGEELGLIITDSAGEEVEGSVVSYETSESSSVSLFGWSSSDGWVAWKAQEDLVEGESYSIQSEDEMVHDHQLTDVSFLAGPALGAVVPEDEPAVVDQRAQLRLDGDTHCCEQALALDSCTYGQCQMIATGASDQIKLDLKLELDGEEANQFAFLAHADTGEDPAPVSGWTRSASWTLTFSPAQEYCYVVRALHLASGTETVIAEGCTPDVGLGFDDHDEAIEQHNRGLFNRCTVPPEGQQEYWCATYAENIASGSCEDATYIQACEAALAACPEPEPPLGTGGSTGSDGSGGQSGDDASGGQSSGEGGSEGDNDEEYEDLGDDTDPSLFDDTDDGTEQDADPDQGSADGTGTPRTSDEVSGCTVSASGGTPGSSPRSLLGAWLALFMGLGWAARRKARGPRPGRSDGPTPLNGCWGSGR